ncbi:uncharacterized protein EKO05_0008402 [Ascochyta rabiei]|uniref:uncharacterized protein n=1 Tax=Didymella rabiei TaxID=5454 RepID=UPI0019020A07|nr:uncharacterized protein EKO05_0008402 [Ascochyta rabiei]UPX18086.1 hypothetical protein EKO05_0008402 [Ascochyta rabiei]
MDPLLHTPRLRLSLLTSAEQGSEELGWLHEWRSNAASMAWSIHPPSKTLSETQKLISGLLPSAPVRTNETVDAGDKARFRIAYAVHRLPLASQPHDKDAAADNDDDDDDGNNNNNNNNNDDDDDNNDNSSNNKEEKPSFIGVISLLPTTDNHLALPPHLTIPTAREPSTLVVELAYAFLPAAWGRGFATEAITAVLGAARSEQGEAFWAGWEGVWMRVVVNERNPASRAVMRRCGVQERGVFEWKGEAVFIGGSWRTEDRLVVLGGWLRGGE